ncbi:hypothetical protein MTO96_036012 [Rhipicephalus appendiculatus]
MAFRGDSRTWDVTRVCVHGDVGVADETRIRVAEGVADASRNVGEVGVAVLFIAGFLILGGATAGVTPTLGAVTRGLSDASVVITAAS